MIRQFVSQGKIQDALFELGRHHDRSVQDLAILLHSQWSKNEKDNRIGIISNDNYNRTRARIVNAILSNAGESAGFVSQVKTENNSLLSIVAENKRRRPKVAEEAQAILNEYREYSDTKAITPSFDPAGRRYRAIQEKEAKFLADYQEAKELSLETTVERIMEYLKETAPDYNDLSEAYKLASGRGMTDGWIVDQLNARPNDDETRIAIAERIENFISRI